MRTPSPLLLLALAALLLAAGVQAQTPPVTVELTSFLVTEEIGADDEIVERFEPAVAARPGDVIEYRLRFVNASDAPLEPASTAVVGPVPAGTAYLAGSATDAGDLARFEASLDGAAFAVPPLLVTVEDDQGERVEVEADPSLWTAVRWVVLEPLAPEAAFEASYRVEVR